MQREGITAEYLEQVFREGYSRYYYYALSLAGDDGAAKDIVSDVFLSVWKNRAGIDSGKLTHYIMVSIHNKCLTYAGARHPLADIDSPGGRQIPDEGADDWKLRERRLIEIEHVLADMNPRTRYVLEQFYYRRRSYKDIAGELGITTDGIKKQLVKGLTILRSHFNINKHKR